MIRKLEFFEIAGYLPYKLHFAFWDTKKDGGRHNFRTKYNCGTEGIKRIQIGSYNDGYSSYDVKNCTPVLRPLSDLFRTITHNVKEIIPIVELAKIYDIQKEWILGLNTATSDDCLKLFGYNNDYGGFYKITPNSYVLEFCKNQYLLFDYLHQLKIDYRGLIESGLAINCNTLENNPYK